MGAVYQATDSKLSRSVAIKFLPETFSHDSERVARFEREARVLASLNHSNIAAIHGLEESGGRKVLVMELAPGENLGRADRTTGTTLDPGAPVALFQTRILGGGADAQQGRQYDVTRDGRFLINTVLDDVSSPITLLMNWKPPEKRGQVANWGREKNSREGSGVGPNLRREFFPRPQFATCPRFSRQEQLQSLAVHSS